MKKIGITFICSLFALAIVFLICYLLKWNFFMVTFFCSLASILFILPSLSDYAWAKPASFGTMNADSDVHKKNNLNLSVRIIIIIFFLPFYVCALYYLTTI